MTCQGKWNFNLPGNGGKVSQMRLILILLTAVCGLVRGDIFADIAVTRGEESLGTIRIKLEHEKVPRVVAAFIGLATGERAWIDPATKEVKRGVPYYDGIIFHRLDHDFVIQGGDPLGTGSNGPGYVVQDQFHPDLRHSSRYVVSTAKSTNPNTFGSQFFITLRDTSNLDDKHSVFGTVISDETFPDSRALIDSFTDDSIFPTGDGERPMTEIVMESVTISGSSLAGFDLDDPTLRLPVVVEEPPVVRPLLTAATDDEEQSFAVVFDRKALHDYFVLFGPDLQNPTYRANVLSADADSAFQLGLGIPQQRSEFYRHIAVDYSLLHNPDPAEVTNGSSFEFSLSNDETLTITADGAGGGSWVDSIGGSGSVTALEITDSVPATGTFITVRRSQAEFFPLMNLVMTLDGAAGTSGVTSLNGRLSYHSESNGGFEGSANSAFILNSRFTFTPANP